MLKKQQKKEKKVQKIRKKVSKLSMDFCDKCGEDIDTLEPCIKLDYGFVNDDKSFSGMGVLYLHIDCFNDTEALKIILDIFDKN